MKEQTQPQDIHPEVEKIFNFEIPPRKIRADLRPEDGKGILLGDLIHVSDIHFDKKTGKAMMKHSGILDICDGIGIEFLEPVVEKTGEREYQATIGIKLGDGTVFYGTGEVSNQNTDSRELSGKFPVNQTHIRALNKTVVRALGLYRVLLTEEEADEFKTPQVQKLQQEFEAKLHGIIQQARSKEERLTAVIAGIMDFVALPSTDERYPHVYLAELLTTDPAYLEELIKGENKIIGFVANQLLKDQLKEQASNESVQEAEPTEEATEHDMKPSTEEKMALSEEEHVEQGESKEETPLSEEEQDAFLKELKEGQEILQKELEANQSEPKNGKND